MLRTSLALALGAFALTASAAEPYATLRSAEGTVMVNQGERYVTAAAGMTLSPGDRVMVMAGSKAEIRFGDGCSLPLGANVVTSIPAQSTCAGGVAAAVLIACEGGPRHHCHHHHHHASE